MNYFVFQVSDESEYGKQRIAWEVFDYLVAERSVWGFGKNTPNRKAIQKGDKALFYLTGTKNQVFVGAATLTSTPYKDETGESDEWFLSPETLRIDLKDVQVFSEPRHRKSFKSIEWFPAQGGSSKISERDYKVIIGQVPDHAETEASSDGEMEYALESHLEDFMVQNWDKIDFAQDLKIYKDANGNVGKQYLAEGVGYIDILATDKDGNFVVLELKKGRENDKVIGQVLRYVGWVRNNLVKKGEGVRGMVVTGERDEKLEYALKEVADKVSAKIYKVFFRLEDY